MCVVSYAHQPYFALFGCPWTRTSCPEHQGSPSVASSPSEYPPRLPQASRVAFSSSNQDWALGRGPWGSVEEEGELRT